MALVLSIKYLDGLEGKADRIVKIEFREYEKMSRVVRGKDSVYIGEQFQWPIGRQMDATDTLEMKVYNYSKYLNNKLIGSLTISLQNLLQEGKLSLNENLVDANHSIIRTTVNFDLQYLSPDSRLGNWREDTFGDDGLTTDNRFLEIGEQQNNNTDGDGGSHQDLSETRSLIGPGIHDNPAYIIDNNSVYSEGEDGQYTTSPKKSLGVQRALLPTLHKVEDYQVSLTIIEARQLAGPNINPCIAVQIGDKTKKTEVKMSTNSPYFNQYLCFDFRMSKAELLDQVIHLRALAMGNMVISRLLPGDLIGEFRMDVRTVYNAQDHMFYHKWAMLIDPKDVNASVKGYVKVDINVIGKGEQSKYRSKAHMLSQTRRQKTNEDEDIEANLLLPQNLKMSGKRQMAEIGVKIYKAEDLPRMNTDFMASIKQAITGDNKPMVDPYVQVSFAGHTAKTKWKKKTYEPEWNEEIVFTVMFPPLCNRIRISLFDWDTVYNECIATHFIELSQIMNDGETGYLPTFGPSWVNLYGTPRNYNYEQVMHPHEELNRGLGEGVAYRGRILMAVKTTVRSDSVGLQAGARVATTQAISEAVTGKKEDFLLVGIIYEASVIDQEIGKKKKPIYFELSIGTNGNTIDGRFNDDEDDDEDENDFSGDANRSNSTSGFGVLGNVMSGGSSGSKTGGNPWIHSTSVPMLPATNDCEYYHLPYHDKKPCLFMRCQHQDHRTRMFIPNILEKLKENFEQKVEEVSDMVYQERAGAHRKMRHGLDNLISKIEEYQKTVKGCRCTGSKTLLDRERQRLVRVHLEKMRVKVSAMRREFTQDMLGIRLKEARKLVKSLDQFIEEPQHSLPDVFVWMLMDNKRVAFARIPARSLIHSSVDEERGKDCSKVATLFLRKPGRKGMGQSGWTLQGQLKIYLWLGLLKEIKAYRQSVPEGFQEDTFKFVRPPTEIIYIGKSHFQFRAHMFMARNLIGSDETGLSDAFARVIVNDHVVTTKIIPQTLSPKWDQTLIVECMTFYMKRETIKESPPVIVVEVFDEDTVVGVMANNSTGFAPTGDNGKSEFLGRCFCRPVASLDGEDYKSPKLDWWEIFRGQTNAGELLAAFELIEVIPSEDNRVAYRCPSIDELKEAELNDPTQPPPDPGSQSVNSSHVALRPESRLAQAANWVSQSTPSPTRGKLSTSPSASVHSVLPAAHGSPTQVPCKPHQRVIVVPVPMWIRPNLSAYRVEMLFWGVRELHRILFMTVDRPKISIEFGGQHLSSEIIASAKQKPNFSLPTKHIDLWLPEDERYWPPMLIQCEDCRQFGRTILVGNHVISSITKYIRKTDKPAAKMSTLERQHTVFDSTGNVATRRSTVVSESGLVATNIIGAQMASEARNFASFSSTLKKKTSIIPSIKDFKKTSLSYGKHPFQSSPVSTPPATAPPGLFGSSPPLTAPSGRLMSSGSGTDSPTRLPKTSRSSSSSTPMASPGRDFSQPSAQQLDSPMMQQQDEQEPLLLLNGGLSPQQTSPTLHAVIEDSIEMVPPTHFPLSDPTGPASTISGPHPGTNSRMSTLQRKQDPKLPGQPMEIKKRPKVPKEDVEDVDWWSRFYATVDDLEEESHDCDSDSDLDVLGDIVVDMRSDNYADDKTGLLEIPEHETDTENPKYKKKRRRKRKKTKEEKEKEKKKAKKLKENRQAKRAFVKKDGSKRYADDKNDDLEDVFPVHEDNSWIERLKLYPSPLEEIREFGGFDMFTKTYPLYKGKQEDDDEPPENRIVGYFKGNILIYKIKDDDFGKDVDPTSLYLHKDLPSNEPVTLIVRIYVIRANDLHPTDPNGKSDPYLVIRLGSKVVNDKENYIPKQLNPVFGKCFEMEAKFPQESMLMIQVMDWDLVSGDDLVGETKIDLENRYYSKHRALCGLAKSYDVKGYNKWRDQLTPSQILARLCKEHNIDMPVYELGFSRVTLEGVTFYADPEFEDEHSEVKASTEPLALEVLQNWDRIPPPVGGYKLVPEHVETRPLFNPEKAGIEQGRLEMWVDMFPKELGQPAPHTDISPRLPKSFELRVIIWNTEDVILNDDAMLTGEKSSDIFVKAWMKGLGIDDQVTDVHYRSLSGEGNFNWRYIFHVDYLKSEDKIVYKAKESPFSIDETEFKAPCKLFLQVWDADIVSADDFLGGMEMLLSRIPRGAKSPQACGLHQLAKDGSIPTFSIFRNRRCRGWWPFIAESEDEPGELEVTGKLDAELQLLTAEEAEINLAGNGRDDPNGLPVPDRPDGSFLSFMNPLKSLKYLICKRYRCLIIKVSLIIAFLALFVLFIYNSPGYLAKKIIGA